MLHLDSTNAHSSVTNLSRRLLHRFYNKFCTLILEASSCSIFCGQSFLFPLFKGIDIGTGGGIYFCSMAAKRFSWSMIGTETNFSDFRVAERNVERNSLSEKVQVIHNDNKSVIFPAKIFELFSAKSAPNHFCFTVCNPPFYEMTEVRRERKQFSDKNPGRDHEMSISGKLFIWQGVTKPFTPVPLSRQPRNNIKRICLHTVRGIQLNLHTLAF